MTEENSTEEKNDSKGRRHLNTREAGEIVSMLQAGVSVSKIAEVLNVEKSTVYRFMKRRGLTIGVASAVIKNVENDRQRAELIEKIKKTKDDAFKYVKFLEESTMMIARDAVIKRNAGELYNRLGDLKALKTAMETIKLSTDAKYRILGLDRENENADVELPELPIRELTPQEIEAIRDSQELEDDDIEIPSLSLAGDEENEVIEEDE